MNARQIGPTSATSATSLANADARWLQFKCACGTRASGGECVDCKRRRLQRKPSQLPSSEAAPPIVDRVLSSSGHALDAVARNAMERHFGEDFSTVRVHTDADAARSAQAVNALAYTVGRHIVFGPGQYAPRSRAGRGLLAHELTHTVQQRSMGATTQRLEIGPVSDTLEHEADRNAAAVVASPASGLSVRQRSSTRRLARASAAAPDAALLTRQLGRVPHSGLRFFPDTFTDTAVGAPNVRGGLLSAGEPQLSVIVGENQTIHTLALELLPLWLTATPFTPPGATAPLPLDIITAEELAQALLVFNQTYLPVPAMTRWRSGLRFPLPVRIDEATNTGILHPLNIRALASGFDVAWRPLLDQRASTGAAPSAAIVAADATAFLAATPDALGRGIALGARAVANATVELPFMREVFNQLGAASFDVALQFMDNLINREIGLLAAQTNGAAILAIVRAALAAAPATPSAAQQASLTRANWMLGRVAGVVATVGPAAMRTRVEKTVTIDTVRLDGSSRDPAADVAVANGIYAQCNVRLIHVGNHSATPAETTMWIGADGVSATGTCGAASTDERRLMSGATTRFALSSRLRAFYVRAVGSGARAEAYPPYCATGGAAVARNMIEVTNNSNGRSLAHEVGHILLNSGNHPTDMQRTMGPAGAAPQGETFNDAECSTIHANA